MKARLVVFARYPQAGKVKTRLIPALGHKGAAELYRKLAERTLQTVSPLCRREKISLEIAFCGGSETDMRLWLGNGMQYRQQAAGDLGSRMAAVFSEAFADGCEHVVIIGTDCPELTDEIVSQAFIALQSSDVILGPAEDGGYYLIGMSVEEPRVFDGIDWGEEIVFRQTMDVISRVGLSCSLLACLADLDRPADLLRWTEFSDMVSFSQHDDTGIG